MDWKDLIHAGLTRDGTLFVWMSPLVWGSAIAVLLWVISRPFRRLRRWNVTETKVKIAGAEVTLHPDNEVVRIAHEAWVELITRKAGLAFDDEHDVIVEVYDSWYELFRELRRLAKTIPAESIRGRSDAEKLVHCLVDALNKILRPHLTEWQARFRRWYEAELQRRSAETPQEVQRHYGHYEALTQGLKKANADMIVFVAELDRLAHSDR